MTGNYSELAIHKIRPSKYQDLVSRHKPPNWLQIKGEESLQITALLSGHEVFIHECAD